jgi:phage terminase large subunit
VGRKVILKALEVKGNILCTRSVQNSIADSVYDLLKRIISDHGLDSHFSILKNEIIIVSTGKKIMFKGCNALTDPKKQGAKGLNDISFVWWEEASTATENELDVLIPSIRGVKTKDGEELPPEFIFTYNSQDCPCAVSEQIEPHEDSDVVTIHYYDNPFLPETIRKEIRQLKKVAPEKYKEIYLGQPSINTSKKVILQAWIESAIRLFKKENDGDTVYSLDPSDEGDDVNALACRKGLALIELYEWDDGDTGKSTRKMVEIIKGKSCHVIFDSVGVGAGVKAELNRLKAEKLINHIKSITAHSNGEKVDKPLSDYVIRGAKTGKKNKDQFSNFGAQHWFRVRELLENAYLKGQGRWEGEYITIDPNLKGLKKLIVELKQIEFEYDSSLKIRIIKTPKGTRSPNSADAFMMSFRKPRVLAGIIS